VTHLARQRHRLELPQLPAGAQIERARISCRSERHLAGVRAEHGDVLVDHRHAVPRHLYLDHAVAPEARGGLTG
jgi:hypothetical protein